MSVLALAVLVACADGGEGVERERRPNVLVVSIDTLRRDHVSAYGYERETTPNLDALAAEGALFLDAVSTSNWTLPAHMSLVTGLPPSLHRVQDDRTSLAEAVVTLPEILSGAGYATAGIASHVYLDARFGFGRGFDHYANAPDQRADAVTDRAIAWLEERGEDEPFFLFLHYFDPHWGYDPPEPFLSRFGPADAGYGASGYLLEHLNPERPLPAEALPHVLRLYDGEIAFADHEIGRLVRWLRERGELDRTVVAVTSDHGEEFGDHGSFGHGTHLHGEVTRVPLILRYPPAVPPGERRGVVTLSDLPPTLLSAAGVRAEDAFGAQALDVLSPVPPDRRVVVESTRWGPKRFAIRDLRHKLTTQAMYRPVMFTVENGETVATHMSTQSLPPGIYDLAADEAELENLLARGGAGSVGAEMLAALDAYLDVNVHAVKLTVEAPSDAPVALEVELDGPLTDEPFVPASPVDVEVLSGEPARVRIRTAPGARDTSVFVPVAEASTVRALVLREGELGHRASAELPAPGGTRRIELGADGPALLVQPGAPSVDVAPERLELDEEDLERLRRLGYVK